MEGSAVNSKGIIIMVVVLIAIALLLGPLNILELIDGDYGTGIDVEVNNRDNTLGEEGYFGNIEPGFEELILYGDNSPITTAYRDSPDEGTWSESITLAGTLTFLEGYGGLTLPDPAYSWYRVQIKGEGFPTWTDLINSPAGIFRDDIIYTEGGLPGGGPFEWPYFSGFGHPPDGAHDELPAFVFRLKGRQVGALKCEVVTHWDVGWPFPDYETVTSRDYIYIISGSGDIWIQGYEDWQVPMYELGESVPIGYDVDYSGQVGLGSGGWEIDYRPRSGDSGGKIADLNDASHGTINWVIPSGLWYPGISDSKIDIVLRNTLFDVDEVAVNTIDLKANAPPTPQAGYTPNADIYVGDTVVLFGNCTVNPVTNAPIDKFMIQIDYTDRDYRMGYWNNIDAFGNPASFIWETPPFPYAGNDVAVQIWAHDEDGRESNPPAVLYITVKTPTSGEADVPLSLIFALLIIVVFVLLAMFLPQPYGNMGRLIIIVLGVALAIMVYVYVDFTPLSDWLAAHGF